MVLELASHIFMRNSLKKRERRDEEYFYFLETFRPTLELCGAYQYNGRERYSTDSIDSLSDFFYIIKVVFRESIEGGIRQKDKTIQTKKCGIHKLKERYVEKWKKENWWAYEKIHKKQKW